ncbi:hypothetical protein [Yoonia rosea]|nr:hypothetical protein [Yoonia rosea]
MRGLLLMVICLFASLAHADGLAEPKGPVILTISGAITQTNGPNVARFDREMLEALERRIITANTPWFDAKHDFEGPLAAAVLDAVGAQGSTMRVFALNDYASDVPVADVREFPVIFATHLDGEMMSVREKGPLFLIYPFDEFPALFNEVYFGRSVWQIARIEVIE